MLKAGLFTAGAAAVGSPMLQFASASAATLPSTLTLYGPRVKLFSNKSSTERNHRMQSFAFDQKNRRLFVMSLIDGGDQQDLRVSRISFYGNLSYGEPMTFRNCGHGVAFGVEGVGTDSYIWLERGAVETSPDYWAGTKVSRFKWEPGRDTASGVTAGPGFTGDQSILSGSSSVTCSVDGTYDYPDGLQRLGVRRYSGGIGRWEVYKLYGTDQAPVLEWAQRIPPAGSPIYDAPFQGWALYGHQIYCIIGAHGSSDKQMFRLAPETMSSTDPNSGTMQVASGPVPTSASVSAIPDCEPEGFGIYAPSGGAEVWACFGLCDGDTPRGNGIFYKVTAV